MLGAACASPLTQKTAAKGRADETPANKPRPEPAQPGKTSEKSVSDATNATNDRAAVEYQIAMLRKEIALYRQFIERAGEDPHYREPVQKSRERIEDAENTIALNLSWNPP
jgi:hypothetical protein